MSDTNTISVRWPTTALTPEQWRRRVSDLAEAAEAQVGKRDVPLQRQAELAMWWAGLCWSGFGCETIAASCRASLVMGEPLVMAAAPSEQLQEAAERLDAIWEAAQADPSAAVATVAPPFLDLPPRSRSGPKPPAAAPPAPAEPAPPAAAAPAPEPADDPDDVPAAWLEPPAAAPEPEPPPPAAAAPAPAPEPPAPAPPPEAPAAPPPGFSSAPELALELGAKPTTIGAWCTRRLAGADVYRHGRRAWYRRDAVLGVYEPRAKRPRGERKVHDAPPGWFSSSEASELLSIGASTIGRWRMAGRFGAEGEGWVKCGTVFFFAPDVVERLMEQQPAELDQLLDQIRA